MKISKFVNNPGEKPFHTSGYARVAQGNAMGVASTQSFAQRQRIEKNRQLIQQYRDSQVANGSHLREELQRRLDAPQDTTGDAKDKHHRRRFATNNRQAFNSGNASSATPPSAKQSSPLVQRTPFKEPPKRGFNPYG